ncbi:MAG: hypothetical protein KAH38_03890 [Candidatus Hydrogenedentes bacterium]|nr:hypothetical protein [Candidatus Hydrogenedentota bacterium]
MSGRGRKIILALIAVMLCYAVAVTALMGVDNTRVTEGMDEVLYLPNEELLSYFTAGLNAVVADFIWLNCIQYTALENRGKRNFTWLERMVVTATRLDPYFVDVYRFGAIFLSALRADPDASLRLAHEGMKSNPQDWKIPYEAAMNYLLNKREEPRSRYFAGQYLNISAATGCAISGVVNLAAKLQDEFDLTEIEKDMWYEMLDSEDKFISELAQRKLIEIELRNACGILNERLEMFSKKTGRPPRSLDEMVEAGFISSKPEGLLGGYFFIGEDNKVYNSILLEDRVLRSKNVLITNVGFYQEKYDAWPESLEKIVEVGLLEEIPVHPWPGREWKYNSQFGEIE